MAPTTLPGQKSATCPDGRGVMEGEPMKVAEVMAQLDGPVYVERTALFDQKSRKRTKKAIHKILKLQAEGRGFGFVEVLAECPTHLKMSPQEAEVWVRECMVPRFPLGVLKNEDREPWFRMGWPDVVAVRIVAVRPAPEASTSLPSTSSVVATTACRATTTSGRVWGSPAPRPSRT